MFAQSFSGKYLFYKARLTYTQLSSGTSPTKASCQISKVIDNAGWNAEDIWYPVTAASQAAPNFPQTELMGSRVSESPSASEGRGGGCEMAPRAAVGREQRL